MIDLKNDILILEAYLFATTEPLSENDLKEKITNKKKLTTILNELQEIIKTGKIYSVEEQLGNLLFLLIHIYISQIE